MCLVLGRYGWFRRMRQMIASWERGAPQACPQSAVDGDVVVSVSVWWYSASPLAVNSKAGRLYGWLLCYLFATSLLPACLSVVASNSVGWQQGRQASCQKRHPWAQRVAVPAVPWPPWVGLNHWQATLPWNLNFNLNLPYQQTLAHTLQSTQHTHTMGSTALACRLRGTQHPPTLPGSSFRCGIHPCLFGLLNPRTHLLPILPEARLLSTVCLGKVTPEIIVTL